jgi:hypothetical protein
MAHSFYTKYYCEENIYRLCRLLQDSYVVFISNPAQKVVFWKQKLAPEDYVVWDYHVILLKKSLVYDFDTTLNFPCSISDYCSQSLKTPFTLKGFERFSFACIIMLIDIIELFLVSCISLRLLLIAGI